jgi:hypothetical protein
MFLRLLFAALFILVFSTCDLVSPNRSSIDNFAVLDTVIDYNKVDVYPLLAACTNCDTSIQQNQCFETEFVKSLERIVNKNKIEVDKKVNDTVFVDILVDYSGRISILKINRNEELLKNIPNFNYILQQSIDQLPAAIQPSLKRGIPVNVKFKLPVVVSVKE